MGFWSFFYSITFTVVYFKEDIFLPSEFKCRCFMQVLVIVGKRGVLACSSWWLITPTLTQVPLCQAKISFNLALLRKLNQRWPFDLFVMTALLGLWLADLTQPASLNPVQAKLRKGGAGHDVSTVGCWLSSVGERLQDNNKQQQTNDLVETPWMDHSEGVF